MFKLFVVVIVTIISVCNGAPIEERSTLQCQPYGKPHGLIGEHEGKQKYFGIDKGSGKHGAMRIVETKTAIDQFQFYKCKAPTKNYFDDNNGKIEYGQLRSVKEEGFCMTSDNTWIYAPKSKDDLHAYTPYPGTMNGSLTLQPCAKEHGLELRLQWFAVDEYAKGCGNLQLQGTLNDAAANTVSEEGGHVILKPWAVANHNESSYLYLADENSLGKCLDQ